MDSLKKELVLPCGARLKNRIAKSAMSENLSTKDHAPSKVLINAYKKWADGGTGLIITGNVMFDPNALGEPRNVVIEDKKHFELLQKWAATVKGTGAHIWPQINHPGRQAMEQINSVLKAPSAVPLKYKGRKNASNKIPVALTEEEIQIIIEGFGNTAATLKEAGFTGVQIHGAHGYLVSQFLSPYTNVRTDQWGGTLENRARFVVEVYRNIRKKVGKDFPVGIKINSADFQKGGFSEEESMEVVKILSKEGIDLIEISGGSYEAPAMMGKSRKINKSREAYFIDYIEKARAITDTPLLLTGGFRTAAVMEDAVASNKLDMVGIARPFAVYPNLTNEILNEGRTDITTNYKRTGVKAVDGAMGLIWYEAQIKTIGEGKTPNPKLSPWYVFLRYTGLIIQKKLFGK